MLCLAETFPKCSRRRSDWYHFKSCDFGTVVGADVRTREGWSGRGRRGGGGGGGRMEGGGGESWRVGGGGEVRWRRVGRGD